MDQDGNRGDNHNPHATADFLLKRRRGRPRKFPRSDSDGLNFSAPPGYEKASGNQTRRGDHISDKNDVMLGQPVNGVIEAAFDAGYMLSVRVGNSDTMLRGVVFKPGRYVPVSADNDVAPSVPMIRRNNVHVSTKGQRARSRDYGVSRVKDRQMVPVSAQPIIPRGYLVPVVLKPANLSNGSNQVPEHSVLSNGSLPTNAVESRPFPSQPQSGSHVVSGIAHSGASHGKPFETLLTEVMKRVQVQAPGPEVEAESDDQALSIEPLQAIHPVHSVSIPKSTASYGTGKMTELLQAVQENMREPGF